MRRLVVNYREMDFPVAPWDPPDSPPRTWKERCQYHLHLCAYRDDDPDRCTVCHNLMANVPTSCCVSRRCPHKDLLVPSPVIE